VADNNTKDYQSPNSVTDFNDWGELEKFLTKEAGEFLTTWELFKSNILDKIHKKLDSPNPESPREIIIINNKSVNLGSFLLVFPKYLASEPFLFKFNEWRQKKELEPLPATTEDFLNLSEEFKFDDYINNNPPHSILNAPVLAQKFTNLTELLEKYLKPAEEPSENIPAEYLKAVANSLMGYNPRFIDSLAKLEQSLTTPPEIELPSAKYNEINQQYLSAYAQQTGQPLSDQDKQDLDKALKDLTNEQIKTFNEKSKEDWKKLVEDELNPPKETNEIEKKSEIDGITGNFEAPGLLELSLENKSTDDLGEIAIDDNGFPENFSSKWYLAFFHQVKLHKSPVVEPPAEVAQADTQKLVDRYFTALTELIAVIEAKKTKLADKLNQELLDSIKQALNLSTSADDSEISGNEPEDQEITQPSGDLNQAIEIWQKVATRWREISFLNATLVASLPAGYGLNDFDLENDDSVESAILQRIQQSQDSPEITAAKLIESAKQFLTQLEEIAVSAGLSKTPEPPESVVPTDLETPPTDQAEPEPTQAEAIPPAQSLNQLTRARQRMLEEVRKTLFDELLQHGLPEEEVQLLVHQYEGEISQDLWLKFIESGGLYQSLSAVQIIELWSGIADDYLDRIAIQKGFQNQDARSYYEQWQADQQKIERRKLAMEDNEFSLIAAAFSPENVSQAFSSLQPYLDPKNDKQWKDLAFSLFVQYCQNQGLDYADLEGQAKQLIDSVFFHLKTIRTTQDPEKFQAAYNTLLELLVTGNEDWRLAFFQNEDLRAVLFSAPELLLAGTQLVELSERWRQAANSTVIKLNQRHLAVINHFNSLNLPDKSKDGQKPARHDYQSQIADELGRNVDLRFALNMVFTSGASTERQREIETALYIYFSLNQGKEIQLDYVMDLIYAGVMADEGQAIEQAYQQYYEPQPSATYASPAERAQLRQAQAEYQEKALAAKHQQQQKLVNSSTSANMRAAVGAAKVAAAALSGNWAKAAQELLTNKELQKKLKQAAQVVASYNAYMLFKILQGILKFFKTLYNIVTFPFRMGGAILKGAGHLIADGASWLVRGASNLISAGSNFFQGLFVMGSTAAGVEAAMEAESQLNALAQDAGSLSKQAGQGLVDAGSAPIKGFLQSATLAGVTSSLATVMAAAFLGPILLVTLITIIVITVIGGAMNDLPMGYVGESLTSFHGISGCWPVDGRISDTPEGHASSPYPRTSAGGTAFDIAVPEYTPVRATFDGQAKSAYDPYGYGNYVILDTTFGATLFFGHLNVVKVPTTAVDVKAGQVIGLSGNTGNSSGPHLHYESITPAYPIRSLVPSVPDPTINTYIKSTDCLGELTEEDTSSFPSIDFSGKEPVTEQPATETPVPPSTPQACHMLNELCSTSADCCDTLECSGIAGIKTCRCPAGQVYEASMRMCIEAGSGFSAG